MTTFKICKPDALMNVKLPQITSVALKMLRAFMVFKLDDLSDFKFFDKTVHPFLKIKIFKFRNIQKES